MKKIISALLTLGLILSLSACGEDKKDDSSAKTNDSATEETGEFPKPKGPQVNFIVAYKWVATDNSDYLMFDSNGVFEYFTDITNEDGSITSELKSSGHWDIDEDNYLELTFENGEVESCDSDSNYFYVGHFDKTFFNGEVEGIDNWYGTYSSELGKITLSHAVYRTTIDVELFLKDESTYNTTLKFDYTGIFATDGYINLALDGEN
ncbi:MAG: hypothetical protein LBM93_00935, partial [Oscillospiraceae bacterium]|nr:hypothetical protein [Oscillospiraceae bacterium]